MSALRIILSTCVAVFVASVATNAEAWVFGEHACITGGAIHDLPDDDRATLEGAWKAAREAAPNRLCAAFSIPKAKVTDQTCRPWGVGGEGLGDRDQWCMRFDALPAFAADHSCETDDLLSQKDWIRFVLRVSRTQLNEMIDSELSPTARTLAWRDGHIDLAVEDRAYLSRAAGNDAHFQSARYSDGFDEHLGRALAHGQPVNAAGLFVNYHAAALALAARWRQTADGDAKKRLALDAFLSESFALHFLQDGFSAGHMVGTWGGALERKGTHDYYCQHGLDVRTWRGDGYAAHGDAFLSRPDRDYTGGATALSLKQLADAFRGSTLLPDCTDPQKSKEPFCTAVFDAKVNACTLPRMPAGLKALAGTYVTEALRSQPMPAREEPSLPRFGQEAGVYVGPSAAIDGIGAWRVGEWEKGAARAKLGFHIGVDLTDILPQYDDTQAVAAELILVAERFKDETVAGLGGRVRAPYYLVPGDIVITGPLALIPSRATRFPIRRAAKGGLIPWQRPFILSENTSFQFVFGRDVSFTVLERLPFERTSRVELFGPFATLRRASPSQGVSTRFHVDVGPQVTWIEGALRGYGAFISLGASTNFYVWEP